MAAVADKVKEIVSDELSVDTGIVTPQARFVDRLLERDQARMRAAS